MKIKNDKSLTREIEVAKIEEMIKEFEDHAVVDMAKMREVLGVEFKEIDLTKPTPTQQAKELQQEFLFWFTKYQELCESGEVEIETEYELAFNLNHKFKG